MQHFFTKRIILITFMEYESNKGKDITFLQSPFVNYLWNLADIQALQIKPSQRRHFKLVFNR